MWLNKKHLYFTNLLSTWSLSLSGSPLCISQDTDSHYTCLDPASTQSVAAAADLASSNLFQGEQPAVQINKPTYADNSQAACQRYATAIVKYIFFNVLLRALLCSVRLLCPSVFLCLRHRQFDVLFFGGTRVRPLLIMICWRAASALLYPTHKTTHHSQQSNRHCWHIASSSWLCIDTF